MRSALAVGVAMLVLAPAAQAHNSHGWFWGAARAEARMKVRYSDVATVDCDGYGQWIWSDRNDYGFRGKLYRHFDCFDTTEDGEEEEAILHVKGRFAFSAIYVD